MAVTLLAWILTGSCLYLVLTSFILIRNRFELTPLPSASKLNALPPVSILIPARNEEDNIEQCVRSACNQDYPNYEVIVLDDRSEDRTRQILKQLEEEYTDVLHVRDGSPKPDDWRGKPWACKQLADHAGGEILFFIDADVQLGQDALKHIASGFQHYPVEMVTVWPRQILQSFWEKTLIPLLYYALTTLLPAIYVYRKPRWLPKFFYKQTAGMFATACGQSIAFRRDAYLKIKGHQAVKDSILEDVELARTVRRKGFRIRMFTGGGHIACRMYRNEKEIRNGFRKNFFAGFGYSYTGFLLAGFLHLAVFIAPFLVLPVAFYIPHPMVLYLSTVSISLILIHRLILAQWFGWNPIYSLTHPIGVIWFQKLGFTTMYDRSTGRNVYWKNREL